MQFIVSFEGQRRPAQLAFGTIAEAKGISRWRARGPKSDAPQIRDAMEFRKLATKRWRYYNKTDNAASSLQELKRTIRSNPSAETGFLLIARAEWHRDAPVLGCCFCRRSWCHHLIIDFLAVHPKVLSGVGARVRGVGTGIIYSLVQLAGDLRVKVIWGEATKNSAPFYEKVLNLPTVTDHFFIQGPTMSFCQAQYRRLH